MAWTPQCAAVPLEFAPAWPVETPAFDPGADELPADTLTGWTLTCPGGGLGAVAADAAAAVAMTSSEATDRAMVAGLIISSISSGLAGCDPLNPKMARLSSL